MKNMTEPPVNIGVDDVIDSKVTCFLTQNLRSIRASPMTLEAGKLSFESPKNYQFTEYRTVI